MGLFDWGKTGSFENTTLRGGVDKAELDAILARGKEIVQELCRSSLAIDRPGIGRLVCELAAVAQDIYHDFELDPKDINVAGTFIDHFAPATVELVKSYAKAVQSGRVPESDLRATEQRFVDLLETFKSYLEKCRADDNEGLSVHSGAISDLLEFHKPV